jgi:hypothetical protein
MKTGSGGSTGSERGTKMKKILFLLIVLAGVQTLSACAIVHRYPAYRGKVLELGTDKPIEGAGVLAVYEYKQVSITGGHDTFLGYQAVLTNTEGKFEIPTVWFTEFMPFSWFNDDVFITIFKKGYGNFPASFPGKYRRPRAKQGRTEPPLKSDWLPPRQEITFWLPKLETEEEIREHDRAFSPYTSVVLDKKGFPPPGTRKGQFLPSKYTGEGR